MDGFLEFTNMIDSSVGSGIDFDNIERLMIIHSHAVGAFAAGFSTFSFAAVESTRKETSECCLARTTWSSQEISMSYLVPDKTLSEDGGSLFLADDIGKAFWAVFTVKGGRHREKNREKKKVVDDFFRIVPKQNPA